MWFKKFKVKDFVLLGIISAIYFVIYMILGMVTAGLNPLVHALMPAVMSLTFGAVIILFLIHKVPKFGVLSIFSLIYMLVTVILGMFYIPWFLGVMISALIGDVIANTSEYQSKTKNALAYGIMQVGNMCGSAIPVLFFANAYVEEWVGRGMDPEMMKESVSVYAGWAGAIILTITFIAGFIGIFIAYKILSKHFAKDE